MQIDHMREFIAVADEGSISTAAARLHITQPVLSKHIRSIEESLHNQLFFRSTRGIIPTPHGKIAYDAFKKIVSQYDELVETVATDDTELCGQIRMGILTMGFDRYVGPIIHGFHQVHPNVSFSYATRQPQYILSGVMDGSIDVGFLGDVSLANRDELSFHCVGRDRIHFVVPKNSPLASKKSLSPEDVAGRPLVCLNSKETTEALNNILFETGYHPSKIIYASEIEIASAEVLSSDGYFVIPDFMCSVFSTYRNVTIVDTAEPLTLPIYFIHKASSRNPLVATFLEWVELRQTLSNDAPMGDYFEM